jgi:hypothetical protein
MSNQDVTLDQSHKADHSNSLNSKTEDEIHVSHEIHDNSNKIDLLNV